VSTATNHVNAFGVEWLAESPPFLIAVTGTRWLTLGPKARRELRGLLEGLSQRGPVTLLHGNAEGVDITAADVAEYVRGVVIESIAPEWDRLGRAAGPVRNAAMLERATHLLAFPGGKGTNGCVALARKKFPHVTIVEVGR